MSNTLPWASAEIFPSLGQRPDFAYPFQVADDAMQMEVHETPYLSNPLLCAS